MNRPRLTVHFVLNAYFSVRAVCGGGDLGDEEPAGRLRSRPQPSAAFPQPWPEADRVPSDPSTVRHLTGEATLNYSHTEC